MDETYIKVKGRWAYLYRAIDKDGATIDFYLSPTRNAKAVRRFLGKALGGLKEWEKPETVNANWAPTYGIAIRGFEVMRALCKGQATLWQYGGGIMG